MILRTRQRARLATLLAVPAVLLAACGGGSDEPDPTATDPSAAATDPTAAATEPTDDASPTFPVTIAAANGEVEIAEAPTRIVSLSPTATEMLFAIGAGDLVVAADEYSNHPEDAPTTDLSGFEPNIEAIAEYDPDLVVTAFDPGDLESGLAELSIPTLLLPSATTLDDTYTQMEQLGVATGHVGDAAEAVADIRTRLEAAVAEAGEVPAGTTYYHELDNTYYSATSATFIGEIYGLFGLENIADAAAGAAESGGFPQLSAEYIIEADPDLIFLASATCCDVTAESVGERPGWEQISAVQHDRVVEVDADITSRWGPRIVDFAELVAAELAQLEAADTAG